MLSNLTNLIPIILGIAIVGQTLDIILKPASKSTSEEKESIKKATRHDLAQFVYDYWSSLNSSQQKFYIDNDMYLNDSAYDENSTITTAVNVARIAYEKNVVLPYGYGYIKNDFESKYGEF
ncbi:MAG: hypothetical protein RR594_03260 [Clostridia bacterium]